MKGVKTLPGLIEVSHAADEGGKFHVNNMNPLALCRGAMSWGGC